MEESACIRALEGPGDLAACVSLLRAAFGTVAQELGLTEESAPTNAAFTTLANLEAHVRDGLDLFGLYTGPGITGCVAVKRAKAGNGLWYIERLAVAPGLRHRGYGSRLLSFALAEIARRGGSVASVGLIDANERLKVWYLSKGFAVRERRRILRLPFAVCTMSIAVGRTG